MPVPLPDLNEKTSHSLANGDSKVFTVPLAANEAFRVRVDQSDVDVTLTFAPRLERNPGEDRRVFSDSRSGDDGPEWLVAIAPTADEYSLIVEAIGGSGSFEIELETLGTPSDSDLALKAAIEALNPISPTNETEQLQSLMAPLAFDEQLIPELVRARIQYEIGTIHRRLSEFPQSLAHFRAAFKGFQEHGSVQEQVSTLNHLGIIQTWLGRLDDAKNDLELALEVGEHLGVSVASASTWNNLGILHATQGQHTEALDAYRKTEERLRGLPISSILADCRHNQAMELLALGRVDAGIEVLHQVADIQEQLEDRLGEGQAWAALGWGYERRAGLSDNPESDFELALKFYEKAIRRLRKEQATWDLTVLLERRGAIYQETGRLSLARTDLERSLVLAEAQESFIQLAWVRLGLGTIQRDSGQLVEARQKISKARDELDRLGQPSGQIAARLELARVERKAGDRDLAAKFLSEALDLIEGSRANLRTPGFRRTYLAIRQEAYEELVDLWAQAAWDASQSSLPAKTATASTYAERAFSVLERGRARSLLDSLATAPPQQLNLPADEIRRMLEALEARHLMPEAFHRDFPALETEDDLRGAGGTEARRQPLPSVPQARTALHKILESTAYPLRIQVFSEDASVVYPLLGNHTTLLAYALGKTKSWLFVLGLNKTFVVPLAPGQEIEKLARQAHELLPLSDTRGFHRAADVVLPELASQVVAPLGDKLPPGRLVVIPDGALHLVPFGLLPGPDGRPLLEKRVITHLPSASAWIRLRQRSEGRKPASNLLALVGDPVFSPEDPRLQSIRSDSKQEATNGTSHHSLYLPRLVATGEEVRKIRLQAQSILGEDSAPIFDSFKADRRLLLDGQLNDFKILHLATHGLVDAEDPGLAGLVFTLFGSDGQRTNGFLPARDLYHLGVGAELVVLSACRTADGQRIRGEGVVGLSHGFFAAGARHLLVTLWDIDDRATAELMTRFYGHLLRQKGDPALALRKAQIELRDETAWRSPKYWAGFLPVGDWQVDLGL